MLSFVSTILPRKPQDKSIIRMRKYNFNPRDAINAASAMTERVVMVITKDRDFELIKEFRRHRLAK